MPPRPKNLMGRNTLDSPWSGTGTSALTVELLAVRAPLFALDFPDFVAGSWVTGAEDAQPILGAACLVLPRAQMGTIVSLVHRLTASKQ